MMSVGKDGICATFMHHKAQKPGSGSIMDETTLLFAWMIAGEIEPTREMIARFQEWSNGPYAKLIIDRIYPHSATPKAQPVLPKVSHVSVFKPVLGELCRSASFKFKSERDKRVLAQHALHISEQDKTIQELRLALVTFQNQDRDSWRVREKRKLASQELRVITLRLEEMKKLELQQIARASFVPAEEEESSEKESLSTPSSPCPPPPPPPPPLTVSIEPDDVAYVMM